MSDFEDDDDDFGDGDAEEWMNDDQEVREISFTVICARKKRSNRDVFTPNHAGL